MPEPVLDARDDERLLDLAVAIADGTLIDWATATPAGSVASEHSVIVRLQHLERLVRGHEAIRSQSSRETTPAHETVLTEARRKAAALPGQSLRVQWGPLVVLDKIGRGSFGDVYRAWDPRLDREVALKLVPEHTPDLTGSPVVEEGRLLARVHHPNVLTVHGAARIDGRVGIWTEYVRGETLAEETDRRGAIQPDEAVRIGVDVCRALGAVHAAGLLHRDVKAQNILRDATGRIVLSDFGTGVEFEDQAGVTDSQVAGTPLYLAPEIFVRQPATVASDLYSVGVLLYFLVTGTYPVRGRTFAEIRRAHATGERVPLSTVRAGLPERFAAVVEALLDARPDGRFQTAAAAESALAGSLGNDQEAGDGRVARRWPWLRLGITAAVSVLLGLVAMTFVTPNRQPRAQSGTGATAHLNAGDWILVAGFDNRTGEAVLDGTIEAALKRELEYSEYVRVAQRDRWEDALRLLGRPLDTPLDPALAREASLRDGSIRRLITGRVEKTGSRYAVTLTIASPADGAALASIREEAPNQAQLLGAVRRQALRLRGVLGEDGAGLERARNELEHVPMPPLKALSLHAKALARGSVRDSPTTVQWHERWAGIEPLLRDALREDPGFAHGWIMLAWALANQGRPRDEYLPYARRAVDLAATATPQERYFIVGSFHSLNVFADVNSRTTDNPRELEQAVAAYEALFALQPDHYYLLNNLQRSYVILGRDHELALMRIRLAEARPANVRLNIDAAASVLNEGNVAAARRYAARAEAAASPDADSGSITDRSEVELFRAYLDWFEEKPRESLARVRRVEAALGRIPDDRRPGFRANVVFLYLTLGRLMTAHEIAERDRVWEGPGPYLLAFALREQGDVNGLRQYLATRWTLDQSSESTARGDRVAFLVQAGMLDEAEGDIEHYKANLGAPVVETSFYPVLMAEVEMGRRRPREAARLLQSWLAGRNKASDQWPARQLADAWLALGETSKAIDVLEKAVEQKPALLPNLLPVAQHMWLRSSAQLAQLYRQTGREPEARAIEQRLLKLLEVADADHPLVMELKARRLR